ncbi:hypothetical protein CHY08_05880 [Rhizobium leguminosarum bv. viciae]|uniref:hypothetical protein n=1 Tax=Rhizobium leguminosarum TaxID=384 RepID=UPI000B8D1703|nr:hypothetical protein [Rhizobium leguminosarum]ASR06682.1 hypothetical protein CHY08_05880 [Rhizobium leguminosarum bv. viciae]
MKLVIALAASFLSAGSAFADTGSDMSACRAETDSLKRLTCYDAITLAVPGTVPAPMATSEVKPSSVAFVSAVLRIQSKDFSKQVFNSRVELRPSFKNDTKKTIVAIAHSLVVTDAFGDKVIDSTDKLDVRIPPGKTVQSEMFYFWEDNPFIQNEPFDLLAGAVSNGTAKAKLTVTKVIYSDGSTESY